MEHQILRHVLGRFKSVDTQPFRSVIPRGDEIPKTLDEAVLTKTPFYKDEKGATQHLAYQKLNDNEVELVQEPSPIRFKDDIFDQSVFDFNDGQQDEIKQQCFCVANTNLVPIIYTNIRELRICMYTFFPIVFLERKLVRWLSLK